MLGVAIPCYKYHIPVLKRCLDSIESQTSRPDFVVVSCSSSNPEDIPAEYFSYSFPLKIQTTPQRLNAAQNRNRAVELLQKTECKIISFFDCDDVMHPQRLEFIRSAWKAFPLTQILLHSYLYTPQEMIDPFPKYEKIDLIVNKLRKAPTGCALLEGNWQARIHHSQVTVSEDILTRVRFREEAAFAREGASGGNEDALFCGDVLGIANIQSVYIRNPLSKYYQEGITYE